MNKRFALLELSAIFPPAILHSRDASLAPLPFSALPSAGGLHRTYPSMPCVFAFPPSSSSCVTQEAGKLARYNVFEPRDIGKVRDIPYLWWTVISF